MFYAEEAGDGSRQIELPKHAEAPSPKASNPVSALLHAIAGSLLAGSRLLCTELSMSLHAMSSAPRPNPQIA